MTHAEIIETGSAFFDAFWPVLLLSLLLYLLHFSLFPLWWWLSGRMLSDRWLRMFRRLMLGVLVVPFACLPIGFLLPDLGRSGEPLGMSYTSALLFSMIASVLSVGFLTEILFLGGALVFVVNRGLAAFRSA